MHTSTAPAAGQASRPVLDIYLRPGTLSLLAGSGESMHELLLYQIARDCRRGLFVGLQALSPLSIFLVDLTARSRNSSLRLLRDLDVNPDSFPLWVPPPGKTYQAFALPEAFFAAAADYWAHDASPTHARLLVLRGLHAVYPTNPNLHNEVSAVVNRLEALAAAHNCAMLASCSVAKTALRQEYRPRDRVFGSAAWSDLVEDILVLDFPDTTTTTDQRRLYLTKRGARTKVFSLIYSDAEGFSVTSARAQDTIVDKLAFLAGALQANKTYSRREIVRAINPDFPVSDASWKRFFNHALDTGMLVSPSRGEYVRPETQTVQ